MAFLNGGNKNKLINYWNVQNTFAVAVQSIP